MVAVLNNFEIDKERHVKHAIYKFLLNWSIINPKLFAGRMENVFKYIQDWFHKCIQNILFFLTELRRQPTLSGIFVCLKFITRDELQLHFEPTKKSVLECNTCFPQGPLKLKKRDKNVTLFIEM